ncbi:MAG: fibrobacter succinogenes major paralogous domain-containing protein, partial [Prevotellaceae bacterium]|nr:fibrobacter succinogenes major paralogous domain-containing protein [Prevotellaceae bacterium]
NAGVLTVTAPASDGKYYAAAGTATLLVSDGAERTITETLALECPAYAAPEALGITFAQPVAFTGANVSQNIGFTTQGAVAFVKALNVPAGWTVTVSPLSGNAGTFTITAPGTPAADVKGEALILAADAEGNSVIRPLPLRMFAAASTQTWTFGASTLVWSDAIHIPECNKDAFEISPTEPQCRSYTEGANTWYYYNWAHVNQHATILCPSPWRVPTKDDFDVLAGATDGATLGSEWGLAGFAHGGSMLNVGSDGNYWSSTKSGINSAYYMGFSTSNANTGTTHKYYGFQVRCVQ